MTDSFRESDKKTAPKPEPTQQIPLLELGERIPIVMIDNVAVRLFNRTSNLIELDRKKQKQADTATKQLYEKVEPGVIKIERGDGAAGRGSVVGDKYILTAAHVVVGQQTVEIVAADGHRFKAEVNERDIDAEHDIAIVKIINLGKHHLPSLSIDDVTTRKPGEIDHSFGHPFGLTPTYISQLTYERTASGLVTDLQLLQQEIKTQEVGLEQASSLEKKAYDDYVKNWPSGTYNHTYDTYSGRIEGGCSGGPLVGPDGAIIGINSAGVNKDIAVKGSIYLNNKEVVYTGCIPVKYAVDLLKREHVHFRRQANYYAAQLPSNKL